MLHVYSFNLTRLKSTRSKKKKDAFVLRTVKNALKLVLSSLIQAATINNSNIG